MNNRLFISMGILLFCSSLFAVTPVNSTEQNVQIAGLFQQDSVSLDSQSIRSSSLGVVYEKEDLSFVGIFTQHDMDAPLKYGYPNQFKSIDMLVDGKKDDYHYIGIFRSESDQPVSGGLSTYQIGTAIGYEISRTENMSVVLGGGVAVGDFDIETSGGKTWPIIPVPLVRINYESEHLNSKFEFLTSPNFSFTLFPDKQLRMTGDIRIDQFRDSRDVIYELNLGYRFFHEKSEHGDFAGISIGIKNDSIGEFTLADTKGDETFEVHYNSLFATLDLSLIKITAGYAFNGRQLYQGAVKETIGDGKYFSVQCVLPL